MSERDLVIGGLHATRSTFALAPAAVLEVWLRRDQDTATLDEFQALARAHGAAVHLADGATLDKLYGDTHHQGVVLRRRPPAGPLLKHWLLERPNAAPPPLLLVLDTLQDPRNFGACLRVADGAGVDAVIFPRDKSARLSSVVAKAASGAIDTLTLIDVPNLAQALVQLGEAGIWLFGATQDADSSLYEVDFGLPAALVLGNEGSGLRRLTRERCDRLVRIPMHGQVASLNVATAAAVGLFEARRQRAAAPRKLLHSDA